MMVDAGVEARRLQFVEAEMLGERLSERCIRLVRGHVGIVGGNGDWALGWQCSILYWTRE